MAVDFLAKLETEIKSFEHELLHQLPKEIQKARELGDLRENAEYSAAKERQDFVSARLRQLKKRLSDLRHDRHQQDFRGLGRTRLDRGGP